MDIRTLLLIFLPSLLSAQPCETIDENYTIIHSRTNNKPSVLIDVKIDKTFVGSARELMNDVIEIYGGIGIEVKVNSYSNANIKGSSSQIINQLRNKADATILLTGQGNGGRAAKTGLLCDPKSVCFSGQNMSVYTAAHELGHLFGAQHTHACSWNGNNTAIDGCGYNAGYTGCPEDDPYKGTIMSYCHVRPVGIELKFHPQVAKRMYNFIQSSCQDNCVQCDADVKVKAKIILEGYGRVSTMPNFAVDIVKINSRSKDGKVLDVKYGYVGLNGDLLDTSGEEGIYLKKAMHNNITIHHRNHLDIMFDYDGSDHTYKMLAGDFDGNGIVDLKDFKILRSEFNKTGYLVSDANGDGLVNIADFMLWVKNRLKSNIL